MRGTLIVKLNLERSGNLCRLIFFHFETLAKHALEIAFSGEHVVDRGLKALPGRKVHLQRPVPIREGKRIHYRAAGVREGARFSDVHATGGQRSSDGREEARAVFGHDRQFIPVAGTLHR